MLTCLALARSVQASRLSDEAPLPGLPFVRIQRSLANVGFAQDESHRLNLQSRILWVDGTANISRTNTKEKVDALMETVAWAGFNTVVYDVRPIVGYTLYPSKLSDRLQSWKGEHMPPDFDPLAAMVDAGHRHGLRVFASLNAFSEGHSYAKRDENKVDSQFGRPGWGYEHPELQSVRYIAAPVVEAGGFRARLGPALNTFGPDGFGLFTTLPPGKGFVAFDKSGHSSTSAAVQQGGAYLVSDDAEKWAEFSAAAASSKAHLSSTASFLPSAVDQSQIPLMMDPHSRAVREREWGFVNEVASNYQVDGILYDDRLRFGGLDSDFSEATRAAFDKLAGKKLHWPDDVYRVTFSPRLKRGIKMGPYFDSWMAFRAATIKSWVARARQIVKIARPDCAFGIYAGSWYGDYPQFGTNYASPALEAGFPFLTRDYRKTGLADELDLLVTGCYYGVATMDLAAQAGSPPGETVEAAGILSNRVADDRCWVCAGIDPLSFEGDPDALAQALQAACATTQGVMVFDLSHGMERQWGLFHRAFSASRRSPDSLPGALAHVEALRKQAERRGWSPGPFPLLVGASGTGF